MSQTPPTAEEAPLIAAALAAREKAYAPYSNFQVGAALRDEKGVIHSGCNVENAAYPLGQCAEASAIGAMILAAGVRISMIVIVGPPTVVCAPCGGCRQRILEFASYETPVILASEKGVWQRTCIGELLPSSFGPATLNNA